MKNNKAKHSGMSLVLSPADIQNQLIESMRTSALMFAAGLLEEDVQSLCGDRFARKTPAHCHRAGSEQGYVYVRGGKVPIRKPRVRKGGKEVLLPSYESMKGQDLLGESIEHKMIKGVYTRNYDEVIEGFTERFGAAKK
jgi:transposase-like protein